MWVDTQGLVPGAVASHLYGQEFEPKMYVGRICMFSPLLYRSPLDNLAPPHSEVNWSLCDGLISHLGSPLPCASWDRIQVC